MYTEKKYIPSAAAIFKERQIYPGNTRCVYQRISSIQIILYATFYIYKENP